MKTAAELREAEEFLHAHIPLTLAMGVRLVPDASGFAVEAPVALNRNHLQTAFGGSINSVATLAGYTFLWLELRGQHAEVQSPPGTDAAPVAASLCEAAERLSQAPARLVVRESSIRFLRPIRETLRAICVPLTAEELATFTSTLLRCGKARLTIEVRIEEQGELAAHFTGTFVAVSDSISRESEMQSPVKLQPKDGAPPN